MRRFLTPRNGSASAFSPVLEKKKREIKRRSLIEAFPRRLEKFLSPVKEREARFRPLPLSMERPNRMWEQDGWVFSKVDDDDNGDEEDGFSITRETTHTNRGL